MDPHVQVKPVDRLLLRAETVARILDIDVSTVRKLIQKGVLPSVPVDGLTKTRLVPQSQLHAWVREIIRREMEQGQ